MKIGRHTDTDALPQYLSFQLNKFFQPGEIIRGEEEEMKFKEIETN